MFFRFVRTVPRVLCFLSRNYSSALQTNQKESLNQALRSLIEDKSKAVWLLKITKCNAEDSFSFSKAYCKVQSVVADTANPEAFPFASLYLKGVNILEDYLNGNLNRLNNLTPPERTCLEKLITFLENKKETTEKILKKSSLYSRHEVQWTAALAVYLLQELAVSSEFILDKFYPKREKLDPKLEYLVGDRFGDTSIGNPEVWHGCADILIGRRHHVQVDVECESHDLEDENSEDENYEEESSLGHQKILSDPIRSHCFWLSSKGALSRT